MMIWFFFIIIIINLIIIYYDISASLLFIGGQFPKANQFRTDRVEF